MRTVFSLKLGMKISLAFFNLLTKVRHSFMTGLRSATKKGKQLPEKIGSLHMSVKVSSDLPEP
jgi:hypothetical protein